jgi:hypothetical protein
MTEEGHKNSFDDSEIKGHQFHAYQATRPGFHGFAYSIIGVNGTPEIIIWPCDAIPMKLDPSRKQIENSES